MLACTARSASAGEWDFLWWLEQLSGPGPFKAVAGLNITQPIACYGVKANRAEEAVAMSVGTPEFFPDFTCGRAARQRVWVRFALRVSRATGDNTLQYAVPLTGDERKVTVWGFGVIADVALRTYLDLGTSVGLTRYSGQPFDSFSRFTIEPIRVTFKPLAVGERVDWRWREFLELRYTASAFPAGFNDADFRALSGTFQSRKEIQSTFAVILNFASLIDRALDR
jgi:hypothetical protein